VRLRSWSGVGWILDDVVVRGKTGASARMRRCYAIHVRSSRNVEGQADNDRDNRPGERPPGEGAAPGGHRADPLSASDRHMGRSAGVLAPRARPSGKIGRSTAQIWLSSSVFFVSNSSLVITPASRSSPSWRIWSRGSRAGVNFASLADPSSRGPYLQRL
jgi:hypothetical protein